MPKSYFDLQRHRKIYPLVRYKPRFVTTNECADDFEVNRFEITAGLIEATYTFEKTYAQVPIVVITPEDENVNAFITTITTTEVTVQISQVLASSVFIHIQIIGEQN